jgi:hypothetical protein
MGRIENAAAVWEWLKAGGLELPEHCVSARIILDPNDIVRIECDVIASFDVDEKGELPRLTKRFRLEEIPADG